LSVERSAWEQPAHGHFAKRQTLNAKRLHGQVGDKQSSSYWLGLSIAFFRFRCSPRTGVRAAKPNTRKEEDEDEN